MLAARTVVVAGDWHCAYVLLYGPRVLEVTEDVAMETDQEASSAAEVASS